MGLNRARRGVGGSLIATMVLGGIALVAAFGASAADCKSSGSCKVYLDNENVAWAGASNPVVRVNFDTAPPANPALWRFEPGATALKSKWSNQSQLATLDAANLWLDIERAADHNAAIEGWIDPATKPKEGDPVSRSFCLRVAMPTVNTSLGCPTVGSKKIFITWVKFDHKANFPEEVRFSSHPSALFISDLDEVRNGVPPTNQPRLFWYEGVNYSIKPPKVISTLLPTPTTTPAATAQCKAKPCKFVYDVEGLPKGVGFTAGYSHVIAGKPTEDNKDASQVEITGQFEDKNGAPIDDPKARTFKFKIKVDNKSDDTRPSLVKVCVNYDSAVPPVDQTEGDVNCLTDGEGDDVPNKESKLTDTLVGLLEEIEYVVGEDLDTDPTGKEDPGYEYNFFHASKNIANPKGKARDGRNRVQFLQLLTNAADDADGAVYFSSASVKNTNGAEGLQEQDALVWDVTFKQGSSTLKPDATGMLLRGINPIGITVTSFEDKKGEDVPYYLTGTPSKAMTLNIAIKVGDHDSHARDADGDSISYGLSFTNEVPTWGAVRHLEIDHPENDGGIIGGELGPLAHLLQNAKPHKYGISESRDGEFQTACVALEDFDEITVGTGANATKAASVALVDGTDTPVGSKDHLEAAGGIGKETGQLKGVMLGKEFQDYEDTTALTATHQVHFSATVKDIIERRDCARLDTVVSTVLKPAPKKQDPISESDKVVKITVNLVDADEEPERIKYEQTLGKDDPKKPVLARHQDVNLSPPVGDHDGVEYVTEVVEYKVKALDKSTSKPFSDETHTVTALVPQYTHYKDEDGPLKFRNNTLELFVYEGGTKLLEKKPNVYPYYGRYYTADTTNADGTVLAGKPANIDVDFKQGKLEVRGDGTANSVKEYWFYVDMHYTLDGEDDENKTYVSSKAGHRKFNSNLVMKVRYRSTNSAPIFSCLDWTTNPVQERDTDWRSGTAETEAERQGLQNHVFTTLTGGGIGTGATACELTDKNKDTIVLTVADGSVADSVPPLTAEAKATANAKYGFGSKGKLKDAKLRSYEYGPSGSTKTVIAYEPGLDFEDRSSHVVTLIATDEWGASTETTINSQIVGTPENPVENVYVKGKAGVGGEADTKSTGSKASDAAKKSKSKKIKLVAQVPPLAECRPSMTAACAAAGGAPEVDEDDYAGNMDWSIDVSDLHVDPEGDSVEFAPFDAYLATATSNSKIACRLLKNPYSSPWRLPAELVAELDDPEAKEADLLPPSATLEHGVLKVTSGFGGGGTCTVTLKANEAGTKHGVTSSLAGITTITPFKAPNVVFNFEIAKQNTKPTFGNTTRIEFEVPENEMEAANDELVVSATDTADDEVTYDLWYADEVTHALTLVSEEEWKTVPEGKGTKITVVDDLDREYGFNKAYGYLEAGDFQRTEMTLRAVDSYGATDTLDVFVEVLNEAETPKLRVLTAVGATDTMGAPLVPSRFSDRNACVVTTAPTAPVIHVAKATPADGAEQEPFIEADCTLGTGETISISADDLFVDEDTYGELDSKIKIDTHLLPGTTGIEVVEDALKKSFTIKGKELTEEIGIPLRVTGWDNFNSTGGTGGARGQVKLTVKVTPNTDPFIAVQPPRHIEVRKGDVYDLNANLYFDDADAIDVGNLTYTFTVDDPEDSDDGPNISVAEAGGMLSVSGDQTGPGAIHVTAHDTVGHSSPEAVFLFDVLVEGIELVEGASVADVPAEGDPMVYAGSQVMLPTGEELFNIGDMAAIGYTVAEDFPHELVETFGDGGGLNFVPGMKGVAAITVTGSNDDGSAGSEECIADPAVPDLGTIICAENPSAMIEFMVTVSNSAPAIAAVEDISGLMAGDSAPFMVETMDADGDAVTTSASTDSEFISVDMDGMMVTAVSAGSGMVTVTADDGDGGMASMDFSVMVDNSAPVLDAFANDVNVLIGASEEVMAMATDADDLQMLTFSAESSDDGIASVEMCESDGGDDGDDGDDLDDLALEAEQCFTVTGVGVGSATVTVSVSDDHDPAGMASEMFSVTVLNNAPEVMLSAGTLSISGVDNTNETVTVTASDPDGHDFTLEVASGNPNIVTAMLIESDDPLGDEGSMVLSIRSEGLGTTMVTVTATDEYDGMAEAMLEVTVTNTRPELSLAASELTITGVGEEGSVGFTASDKDGDDLDVTAVSANSQVASVSVDMENSEVQVTSTGVGETMVTVTVDDGQEIDNTASAEFMVTVLNRDPTITLDETAITVTGVGVSASVSGSASDPDGHSITLSAASDAPGVASAIVSGPSSGGPISVTVTSTGVGTAVITVAVADGYGGSASAGLTVTVENRPPTISVSPESLTITGVGESGEATIATGDPDGHAVTVTMAVDNAGVASATMSGNEVSVTSTGVGAATITFTADDGQASNNTATAELTIEVLNRPPTVSVSPSSLSIVAGGNTGTATISMSDPDGHSLTPSAATSSSSIATAAISGTRLTVTSGSPGSATVTVTVDDGFGGTASDTVSVTVTNTAPVVGDLADVLIQLGGTPAEVAVSVSDPDGHSVTWEAASGTPGVAGITRSATGLTVRALSVGDSVVTVTVTDTYGATGSGTFTVTVSDSELKAVASRSIAAMGRVHIASVAGAIEGRMAGAASAAAGGSSLDSLFSAFSAYLPDDGASFASRQPTGGFQDMPASRNDAGLAGAPDAYGQSASLKDILNLERFKNGFDMNLGQALGGNFGLWGAIDSQSYEGDGYEGGLTNFWIGADISMDSNLLAGLAIGRSSGESDYTFGTVTRTMEAGFTSFMPYAGMMPDDKTSVWGAFAFGSGELETEGEKSDLSVSTGVIGGRRSLDIQMMEGMEIAVKGDFGFNTIETAAGTGAADGIEASVSRLRVAVEGSWVSEVADGQSFEPFIDLGFRSDSGDGDTGSGFEIGGGVRLCADNFKLEARFHVTAQHAAEEYSETGFGLVASVNPDSDGSGLTLSVSPSWGSGDGTFSGEMLGNHASLAQGGLDRRDAFSSSDDDKAIDASISYGFMVSRDRMLFTPFMDVNASGAGRSRVVLGARLINLLESSNPFNLELQAGQSQNGGSSRSEVGLKGSIRF